MSKSQILYVMTFCLCLAWGCGPAPSPRVTLPRIEGLAREVLRQDLRHKEATVRASALAVARRLPGRPLWSAARRLLEDPDPDVRLRAALLLASTPRGAATLVLLLKAREGRVQAAALAALARLRGEAARPLLLARAAHTQPAVRQAAVTGLGKLRRDASVLRLLQAALEDRHLGVRLAAVEALRRGASPAVRPALVRLARSRRPYMALRAGLAMLRAGRDQPLLDAVARGLVHQRWTVRVAALNAAATSGHKVAAELARRALADVDPRVRLAAARLLLTVPSARSLALRRARGVWQVACESDRAPGLCIQAAEVLARAGVHRGTRTLARLARRGKEAHVRATALRVALLTHPDATLARDSLADRNHEVRHAAAWWVLSGVRGRGARAGGGSLPVRPPPGRRCRARPGSARRGAAPGGSGGPG